MASETNLTRVNIFSSETQYNNNKSSLDGKELSIIPAPNVVLFSMGGSDITLRRDSFQNLNGESLLIQRGTFNRSGPLIEQPHTHTITFNRPFLNGQSYFFFIRHDVDKPGEFPSGYISSERSGTSITINVVGDSYSDANAEWLAIGRG